MSVQAMPRNSAAVMSLAEAYFTKTAAAITVPTMNLTTSFSAATAALYIMAAVLPQGMKMLTAFIPKAACAQAC